MPFTISHTAAAWPIRAATGRRLRLAPLVIGAMAPDFVYFAHLATVGEFGHTALGLFLFCVPAGWLALWLFDRLGIGGVNALLPWQWRLARPARQYPFAPTSLALLLGAASHVAWDSLTHADGLAVLWFPVLAVPFTFGPYAGPAYKLCQHASTIAGLVAIGVAVARWTRTRPSVPLPDLVRRAVAPALVVAAAGLLNGLRFAERGAMAFSVAAGVAVALTVCVGPVILGAWLRALPSQESSHDHAAP